MWKLTKRCFATASAFLVLSHAPGLHAAGCFSESPNLAEQGDDYYNLGLDIVTTESEKARLNAFYDVIEGEWQGQSVDTTCKGSDQSPRQDSRTAALQVEVQPGTDGGLKIIVDKSSDDGANKHTEFELLGENPIFTFELTPDNLEFSSKQRTISKRTQPPPPPAAQTPPAGQTPPPPSASPSQPPRTKNTRILETIYKLEAGENTLTVTISHYSNGYLAGEDHWSLDRK